MNNVLHKMMDEKERKEEFLKCPNCGKKLVDNTFLHGSRTGGEQHCDSCDYRAIF